MVFGFAFYFVILLVTPSRSQIEDGLQCEESRHLKIHNGKQAKIGQFPYSVTLVYDDYQTRCSGALLSKRHVLTAAHCPVSPTGAVITKLLAGDVVKPDNENTNNKTRQLRKFTKYFRHPKYKVKKPPKMWFVENAQYDIAVLLVDKPYFEYTSAVRPIELASFHMPVGSNCILPGWGRLDWKPFDLTRHLQYANDTLRGKKYCWSTKYHIYCGGLRFGCPGDCGAPLVCKDGSVTGVFNNAISKKRHGMPFYMLYADVYWHKKWIESKLKGDKTGMSDVRYMDMNDKAAWDSASLVLVLISSTSAF